MIFLHKKYLYCLLMGIIYSSFTIDHKSIRCFTISKTDKSPELEPYKSCSDLVQAIKRGSYQECLLRITKTDQLWSFQPGFQISDKDEPVVLFSRGFRGVKDSFVHRRRNYGQCLPMAYKHAQIGIVQTRAIGFDYIDRFFTFDHAGKRRIDTFIAVLKELSAQCNKIILFGDCIGGKTILSCTDRTAFNNVSAIILEAPVFNIRSMAENIGAHNLKKIPGGSKMMYIMFRYMFPAYKKRHDITLERIKTVPTHIPILIGHLYHDQLVSDQNMKLMVAALVDSGHQVYFLVIDNPKVTHSRIGTSNAFRYTVNAFYKKHNLPHDAQLALLGEQMLENAAQNATNKEILHVEKV